MSGRGIPAGVLAVAAVLAACGKPAFLPVGTRVPIAELRAQRDLRGFVVGELERGRPRRAYFALDLMKTRPYVEQQLGGAAASARLADLRPLVGDLIAGDGGRGLRVVGASASAPAKATPDDAFWRHVTVFEQRTAALNPQTPGLPYAYAARRAYGVSSVEETGLVFSSGEAFLSFVIHGDRAFGFLVVDHQLVVKPLGAPVARLRDRASQLLAQVRDPDAAEWRAPAAELHDAILGPFAAELASHHVEALFVSPDGFLANLPFAVLLERAPARAAGRAPAGAPAATGRRPLVEHYRITYLPSASVYRQLVSRPILDEPPRLLAIGNPTYPAGVPALPFAEREAVTVAELFPDSLLLAGEHATETRMAAIAPRFNILHLATHGLLLGDVARDASSLLLAAGGDRDGFWNAAEIASLDLSRTYLAVLSACETAVAEDAADLGSITNAFLGAGAPSVIGSLWQVEDEATTALMLQFYQRFLEVGAGEALRQAMLALARQPRFAHPFFWAAFTLHGWDK